MHEIPDLGELEEILRAELLAAYNQTSKSIRGKFPYMQVLVISRVFR